MPVKELCWKHRFGDAAFYIWRAKFGGMEVSEARRLKDLEVQWRRFGKRSTSLNAAPAGLSGFLAACCITTRSRTTRTRC